MRRFVVLTVVSLLAAPGCAAAQDASSQAPYQSPPSYAPPAYAPAPDAPPPMMGGAAAPPMDGAAPPPMADAPPPYAPPPYAPPDGGPGQAPPAGKDHMAKLQAAFAAANATHDGRLTLAQAQEAGMRPVVKHFAEIDPTNRGYVTMNQLEAWHMEQAAKKMEQKAAQLRAQN